MLSEKCNNAPHCKVRNISPVYQRKHLPSNRSRKTSDKDREDLLVCEEPSVFDDLPLCVSDLIWLINVRFGSLSRNSVCIGVSVAVWQVLVVLFCSFEFDVTVIKQCFH